MWPPTAVQVRRTLRRAAVALAVLILAGNALLWGASFWARTTSRSQAMKLTGVPNFAPVDDHLWRGGEPTEEGYRALAAHGVTTVVDLAPHGRRLRRTATGAGAPSRTAMSRQAKSHEYGKTDGDDKLLDELRLEEVELPVVDGALPSRDQVERFLGVVRRSPGIVFVHCRAGVGRTGTMAGAYLVTTKQATAAEALRRNLAVGPPSLEQVVFVARLDRDLDDRPPSLVTAASRIIDAPRLLWNRL